MKKAKELLKYFIKKILGINNFSLYIKKKRKKALKILYKKKYSADDLVAEMCRMGMKKGSVIFIHSSMTEFYNYTGTAKELVEKIIAAIGEEGTLMMPAYPLHKSNLLKKAINPSTVVFDVKNTPSGAGYLTEIFRTFPGVIRSINLQHSVCAYGKLADYFVGEHHLSEVAWDSYSPYYKLTQTSGLIFCLGLEPYLRNVTLIHCVEAALRNRFLYFSTFFGKVLVYNFLDENGNMGRQKLLLPLHGGIRSEKVIRKYFDKSIFKRKRFSNLNIESIESVYMYNRCVELIENGISIYKKPNPNRFIVKGKFLVTNEKRDYKQ